MMVGITVRGSMGVQEKIEAIRGVELRTESCSHLSRNILYENIIYLSCIFRCCKEIIPSSIVTFIPVLVRGLLNILNNT